MTAEVEVPVGPHDDEPHQGGLNNRLNWLRAAGFQLSREPSYL